MTAPDSDLIAWLRQMGRGDFRMGDAAVCQKAAARLEALTAPSGGPIGEVRLAEIREDLATAKADHVWGVKNAPGMHYRRRGCVGSCDLCILYDLLAALDFERRRADLAEMALVDLLAEDGRYDAGVRAGVAMAIRRLNLAIEDAAPYQADSLRARGGHRALIAVRDSIVSLDGPASLPPHEQTLADCRRLRATLEQIAGLTQSQTAGRMAREALGGGE